MRRGGKWWRLKYRVAGKEELLSLGTYPDVSLATAREAREEARRQPAAGIDPPETRRQEKRTKAEESANDFDTLAREWLENVKPAWAAVYHGDTVKRFESFVFPTIGRRPVAKVSAAELLPVLRKIEARGTQARRTRCSALADRCFGTASRRAGASAIPQPTFAVHCEPCRVPSTWRAAKLPAFLGKIESYDGEHQTKLALRLLALTGRCVSGFSSVGQSSSWHSLRSKSRTRAGLKIGR